MIHDLAQKRWLPSIPVKRNNLCEETPSSTVRSQWVPHVPVVPRPTFRLRSNNFSVGTPQGRGGCGPCGCCWYCLALDTWLMIMNSLATWFCDCLAVDYEPPVSKQNRLAPVCCWGKNSTAPCRSSPTSQLWSKSQMTAQADRNVGKPSLSAVNMIHHWIS